MTRAEIDAKLRLLWDDLLRESGFADDSERPLAGDRFRAYAGDVESIRAALQGEPERGKTCATCEALRQERDWWKEAHDAHCATGCDCQPQPPTTE